MVFHVDFIDDKERQQVPGPNGYETSTVTRGKGALSKYKSASVGGIMVKSVRFATEGTTNNKFRGDARSK